jgi:FKBP12-rapamycin complex-associated protein
MLDLLVILVNGLDSNFCTHCYIHRCYLKLGQWQESLHGINELTIPAVLQYYATATDHDATWYKAWHAWAYMNFETVLFYKQQQQQQQINEVGGTANRIQADISAASRAGLVSSSKFGILYKCA